MGSEEGRELKESSLEQAVYLSVQSQPGTTVDAIARQHKRRAYTVEGALKRISRWGYITSTSGLYRDRLFFPVGMFSLNHADLFQVSHDDLAYVVSEPVQDIIQYIASRGYASTAKEIVRSTDQGLEDVQNTVGKLESIGLVERGLQSVRKEYTTLTSGVVVDPKRVSEVEVEARKVLSECERKVLFMKMLRQPVLKQVISYVVAHGDEESGKKTVLLESVEEERSRYEYTKQLQEYGFVETEKVDRGTVISVHASVERMYRELLALT